MSEFSDKLSEYIAKSGSNVYQLAKEASLDRTTLQKTAKGQRLPSLDYIREICQYIKISSKQEEELVRLYKIEKHGMKFRRLFLIFTSLEKMRKVPGIFVLMK